MEQIQTQKGPSTKSLFLHKTPPVKSTPPASHYFIMKVLKKNISSVIPMVIFTYNCVICFSILMCLFSEMQFGVIQCKTWGSTQPYVAFSTLAFCHTLSISLRITQLVELIPKPLVFLWYILFYVDRTFEEHNDFIKC